MYLYGEHVHQLFNTKHNSKCLKDFWPNWPTKNYFNKNVIFFAFKKYVKNMFYVKVFMR